MWRCVRQNSLYVQSFEVYDPTLLRCDTALLGEWLPMFFEDCIVFISRGREAFTYFPTRRWRHTYHSHPTKRNDIPEGQNPLLFVPYTWEHRPVHDELLHTLQAPKHWYVLRAYQLLCLSVVKFTLRPSLSVFKEAQSKKDCWYNVRTVTSWVLQSKRHPRLEAVCTVATQRKDLAWCSNLCAPLLEIPSPLKCQLPISFSTWQYI